MASTSSANKTGQLFGHIVADAFVISLVTYLIFFLAELLKHGFVTNYINMNVFLLFIIILGMVTVSIDRPLDS